MWKETKFSWETGCHNDECVLYQTWTSHYCLLVNVALRSPPSDTTPTPTPPPRSWQDPSSPAPPPLHRWTPPPFHAQPSPAGDRAPISIIDRDVDRILDEFFVSPSGIKLLREKETFFYLKVISIIRLDADFLVVHFCIPWLFLSSSVFYTTWPRVRQKIWKRIHYHSAPKLCVNFDFNNAKRLYLRQTKKNKVRPENRDKNQKKFQNRKRIEKSDKRRRGSVEKNNLDKK